MDGSERISGWRWKAVVMSGTDEREERQECKAGGVYLSAWARLAATSAGMQQSQRAGRVCACLQLREGGRRRLVFREARPRHARPRLP